MKHIILFVNAVAAAIVAIPVNAAPVLSGKYIYSWIESCPGTPAVSETTGVITFTPATGKVSLSAEHIGGQPLGLRTTSGTTTYSTTTTTLVIGSSIYHAYYGKTVGGITQNVGAIGLYTGETQPCGDQFTLTQE